MLKKIILASFLLAHVGLFSGSLTPQSVKRQYDLSKLPIPRTTPQPAPQPRPAAAPAAPAIQPTQKIDKVDQWLGNIKTKVGDLKAQATIINDKQVTQRTIARDDFTLKSDLYDIVSMLERMINPSSAIHKKLQKNLAGLAWYQRWFGLAPGNIYQYFEKFIFPLIQDAPIYQDLADQGVQILVSTYVDEINKHIKIINENPNFAYGKPFTDALAQLAEAFKIYNEFLLKNKTLLPVGSYNKIASSSMIRSLTFGASAAGVGGATAWKLGLDPRKIMAEKAEIESAFARSVPLKSKVQAGAAVLKEGWQAGTEHVKSSAPGILERSGITEKAKAAWEAAKGGAKTAKEAITTKTAQLSKGYLGGTKGLEDVQKTTEYTYQQAKYAIYGKILAAAVASYIGYQTVKWLLKDWPRKKFTPSGQPH